MEGRAAWLPAGTTIISIMMLLSWWAARSVTSHGAPCGVATGIITQAYILLILHAAVQLYKIARSNVGDFLGALEICLQTMGLSGSAFALLFIALPAAQPGSSVPAYACLQFEWLGTAHIVCFALLIVRVATAAFDNRCCSVDA